MVTKKEEINSTEAFTSILFGSSGSVVETVLVDTFFFSCIR